MEPGPCPKALLFLGSSPLLSFSPSVPFCCYPPPPQLATVWICPLEDREGQGGWKWKWNRSVLSRRLKVKVKSLSPVRLWDPMDCSPPGSSVHRIFQARILEWVAISFSRGSSQPRQRTRFFLIVGRRFTVWATREARKKVISYKQEIGGRERPRPAEDPRAPCAVSALGQAAQGEERDCALIWVTGRGTLDLEIP